MAEERSEKPTQQKLNKAKKEAQSAKSSFLAAASLFFFAILLIWAFHTLLSQGFQKSMHALFSQMGEKKLDSCFKKAFIPLIFPTLAIMVGVLIIANLSHLFQTGWIWTRPKTRKKNREIRIFLPLLQLSVITLVGYYTIHKKIDPQLFFQSTNEKACFIFKKLLIFSLEISSIFIILGIFDFFYQKWRFYKKMHMTPQERKQEMKENETDPSIKNRMKKKID